MQSRVVATLVIGLGILLAAAVLVRLAIGSEPDYARLVPAPDVIVWEEGDETTLWLATNREEVDLRIDSVSLGLGNINRVFPTSGETLTLGRAEGCQDWAVSKLSAPADYIDANAFRLQGEIDRNGFNEDVTVYFQYRHLDGPSTPAMLPGLGDSDSNPNEEVVAGGSTEFEQDLVQAAGGVWVVEASSDDQFPAPLTRTIRVDMESGTATTDTEAEELKLARDTGIGLIACSEHDDVVVTLHGEDDEELNRYLLDIEPGTAAVARHNPDAGYDLRRVCVDAADHQLNYLDGGELVGGVFDEVAFGLSVVDSVTLEETDSGNSYRYLFSYSLTGNEVQLSVSAAGGSGFGLDATQVYPIRIVAVEDDGIPDDDTTPDVDETADLDAHVDVGVWLDTSTLSPGDDGQCS